MWFVHGPVKAIFYYLVSLAKVTNYNYIMDLKLLRSKSIEKKIDKMTNHNNNEQGQKIPKFSCRNSFAKGD